MTRSEGQTSPERESLDAIARDLSALREAAGVVPYAEIARRIGAHRVSAGAEPATSRPARSTVYDVFRQGRSRVSAALVGEVVRALGEDDAGVARWIRRCHAANAASERAAVPEPIRGRARMSWQVAVGVLASCLVLDFAGHTLVGVLHLSLYLDMIGTALAAIVLGPWPGVLVALVGNTAGLAVHGTMVLPFTLVNVVGALVWGYGIRRWQLGTTVPRFLVLSLIAAVACTLVAVPVLVFGFGGGTGHAGDALTRTLESFGAPLGLAVLQANLVTSIADKLLSGFLALALASAICGAVSKRDRGGVPLLDVRPARPRTWVGAERIALRPHVRV